MLSDLNRGQRVLLEMSPSTPDTFRRCLKGIRRVPWTLISCLMGLWVSSPPPLTSNRRSLVVLGTLCKASSLQPQWGHAGRSGVVGRCKLPRQQIMPGMQTVWKGPSQFKGRGGLAWGEILEELEWAAVEHSRGSGPRAAPERLTMCLQQRGCS